MKRVISKAVTAAALAAISGMVVAGPGMGCAKKGRTASAAASSGGRPSLYARNAANAAAPDRDAREPRDPRHPANAAASGTNNPRTPPIRPVTKVTDATTVANAAKPAAPEEAETVAPAGQGIDPALAPTEAVVDVRDEAGGAVAAAAAPAPAGRARPAATGDMVTYSLAYPTGDPKTSTILLEKTTPRRVRLGQPYTYEVRVTNLTDNYLSGVTIEERFPETFKPTGDEGEAAEEPDREAEGAAGPDRDADTADTATEWEEILQSDAAPKNGAAADGARLDLAVPAAAGAKAAKKDELNKDAADAKPAAAAAADSPAAAVRTPPATKPTTRQVRDGQQYVIGELAPRASRTIMVNGVAEQVGRFGTCTIVTYNPTLCAMTEVINPTLKLVKEGPKVADLCESFSYRYLLSNTGTGTETNVRLEEKLPEGITTDDGRRVVTFDVGDLPEGRAREFIVKLKAAKAGKYTSRATATGSGGDFKSPEVTTMITAPKLAVEIQGPDTEYLTKTVTYQVTVTNNGDAPAREVAIEVTGGDVADLVGFGAGQPPAGREGRPKVPARQTLGTIEPGKSQKTTVTFLTRKGGLMKASATASGVCADAVTAAAQTKVMTIPALLLEVVDSVDPIRVGENTVYRVAVRNQGTGADKDVSIVATLPASMTFVKAGGQTEAKAEGQKVTFTPLATLAPGEVANWEVEVKANKADDSRFQIEMTSESLTKPVTENESTRLY